MVLYIFNLLDIKVELLIYIDRYVEWFINQINLKKGLLAFTMALH